MRKISAVMFDLDDTLYPENEYKRSGFRHVAKLMADEDFIWNLLTKLDSESERPITEVVNYLVREYREHEPDIECYDDVEPVIKALRECYKIGLITNDRFGVQSRKLEALGIAHLFDVVVYATPPDMKPSTKPYELAIERLGVEAEQCVYVGDNLEVDFVGANALAIRTVLIERKNRMKPTGPCVNERWEPTERIGSLYELEAILRDFQENGGMRGHRGCGAGGYSVCPGN